MIFFKFIKFYNCQILKLFTSTLNDLFEKIETHLTDEYIRRITLTWKNVWSLKLIFKGPFSEKQKSDIFNSPIVPFITYGSQT